MLSQEEGKSGSTEFNTTKSLSEKNMMINIFEVIPNDLIGEILGHINSVDLIFSFRRVCKLWKNISNELIWRDHHQTLSKFQLLNDACNRADDLDVFLTSTSGKKFVKYLLRRQVYEFACKLSKIATISEDEKKCSVSGQWIDSEIAILKTYFNEYSSPSTSKAAAVPQKSEGFLGAALSYIGSFFSKNPKTSQSSSTQSEQSKVLPTANTTTSTSISSTATKPGSGSTASSATSAQNQDYEYLTKILLDGDMGSGKSSLLNCAMHDRPITAPYNHIYTIGVDFAVKNYALSETTTVRLQFWDQAGPERFRSIIPSYYRGASVVLFLVDPYSDYYNTQHILARKEAIQYHAPKADVIFITTKKDFRKLSEAPTRKLTNEQAELFAFENFGTFHLDISNTEIEEQKSIVWFGVLMKYLLGPPVVLL